jgi:hypothetical protein
MECTEAGCIASFAAVLAMSMLLLPLVTPVPALKPIAMLPEPV